MTEPAAVRNAEIQNWWRDPEAPLEKLVPALPFSPVIHEVLAYHEVLRRFGIPPEDIFVASHETTGQLQVFVKEKPVFVIDVAVNAKLFNFAKNWPKATVWWNTTATNQERERIYASCIAGLSWGGLLQQMVTKKVLPQEATLAPNFHPFFQRVESSLQAMVLDAMGAQLNADVLRDAAGSYAGRDLHAPLMKTCVGGRPNIEWMVEGLEKKRSKEPDLFPGEVDKSKLDMLFRWMKERDVYYSNRVKFMAAGGHEEGKA